MINEKLYLFPDPTLSVAPADPFLCRDHDALYSKLQGVLFDILRGISKRVPQVREARCVHIDPKCTFDNSEHFVGDVANKDSRYQLVAGRYLPFMEHLIHATRCTRSHEHTTQWLPCPCLRTHGTTSRRRRNKCFNLSGLTGGFYCCATD